MEPLSRHRQLLGDQGFLGFNQPILANNHVLYQLIAAATVGDGGGILVRDDAMVQFSATEYKRVLDMMLSSAGALHENSIGYHSGVLNLSQTADKVFRLLLGQPNSRSRTGDMIDFLGNIAYPTGSVPANGDTYWERLKAVSDQAIRDRSDVFVDEDGGYARLNWTANGATAQINVFATSHTTTHKHEDDATFTLWFNGHEVLTDPGFWPVNVRGGLKPGSLAHDHNAVVPQNSQHTRRPGFGHSIATLEHSWFRVNY